MKNYKEKDGWMMLTRLTRVMLWITSRDYKEITFNLLAGIGVILVGVLVVIVLIFTVMGIFWLVKHYPWYALGIPLLLFILWGLHAVGKDIRKG